MITREDAIETLDELIVSGILDKELAKSLEEIRLCIKAEFDGRHEWGANETELVKLYARVRSDLVTPEYVKECEKLDAKFRFTPSDFEEDELIQHQIDYTVDELAEELGFEDAEEQLKNDIIFAKEFLWIDKKVSK